MGKSSEESLGFPDLGHLAGCAFWWIQSSPVRKEGLKTPSLREKSKAFLQQLLTKKTWAKGQALAFFQNYLTGLLSLYLDGVTVRKSSSM